MMTMMMNLNWPSPVSQTLCHEHFIWFKSITSVTPWGQPITILITQRENVKLQVQGTFQAYDCISGSGSIQAQKQPLPGWSMKNKYANFSKDLQEKSKKIYHGRLPYPGKGGESISPVTDAQDSSHFQHTLALRLVSCFLVHLPHLAQTRSCLHAAHQRERLIKPRICLHYLRAGAFLCVDHTLTKL